MSSIFQIIIFSILVFLIIFIIFYHTSIHKNNLNNIDNGIMDYPQDNHSIPRMNYIHNGTMNYPQDNHSIPRINDWIDKNSIIRFDYPQDNHSIQKMNDWIDKDSIIRFDYPQDNHSIPRINDWIDNINDKSIPRMDCPNNINKFKDKNHFYFNNLWNIQPQEIPTMMEETTYSPFFLDEETTPNYSFEDIKFY